MCLLCVMIYPFLYLIYLVDYSSVKTGRTDEDTI